MKNHKKSHVRVSKGRSMIEMLGVLAVIGVLSIAALAGFQYAMNRHRANETIHDVMLRATNVPMEYDDYHTNPPAEYLFPSLGEDQGRVSTMQYRLRTVPDNRFGYYYRVDGENIPEKVCRQILLLEPTDIDEIRVGTNATIYTRGAVDLCDNSEQMYFLFEKICTSSSDCNECQDCVNGYCKANYTRPGCGEGGCPDFDGCSQCEEVVTDSKGCPTGCRQKECRSCALGSTEVGTDTCGCPICRPDGVDCPDFNGCGNCQTAIYDAQNCPIGCQTDEDCCIEAGGHLVDISTGECCETRGTCCSTDASCADSCLPAACCPNCDVCPPFTGCGECEVEATDENGCQYCTVDSRCCEENGGEIIENQTGACCDESVSCCSLNSGCTPTVCTVTDSSCCPEFNGCGECQVESTDENGCRTCVADPDTCCGKPDPGCGVCQQVNEDCSGCVAILDCDPCEEAPTSHECRCKGEPESCGDCEIEATNENGCKICEADPACACDPPCGECQRCENNVCVPDATDAENCDCLELGGEFITYGDGECCATVFQCCSLNSDCPPTADCDPQGPGCPLGCPSGNILNAGKTCSDNSDGYFSVTIDGNPSSVGNAGCCIHCTGEPMPTAYWNGSSGVCCFGSTYEDPNGNYGCCERDSSTPQVTAVRGGTGRICCARGSSAFYNGSAAQCCDGEVKKVAGAANDLYYCCEN